MSQKSSLPQAVKSVSQALMTNSVAHPIIAGADVRGSGFVSCIAAKLATD
jgi:hypothetical protein